MTDEELLTAWRQNAAHTALFAVKWLHYIGIHGMDLVANVEVVDVGLVWSFEGALFLAQAMPDEFYKWRVLQRLTE